MYRHNFVVSDIDRDMMMLFSDSLSRLIGYCRKYFDKGNKSGCIIFGTDNVKFFCITVLLLFSPFLRQNKRDGPHANLIKERTPSLWIIVSTL